MSRIRKWLPLSAIRIDRMPINRDTLALADFIRNGGEVKPIRVQKIWISKCDRRPTCSEHAEHGPNPLGHHEYHIRDGRYRWLAYKLLGREKIEVVFGEPNNA